MAIQKGTRLKVADNSGALEIECFHIVGSTGKKIAQIGDIIICAVKRAVPNMAVKRSEKVAAVIVRTRRPFGREDGSYISFSDNAVVLLKSTKVMEMRGTRVFGPVVSELRKNFSKTIVSLASEVV